GVVAGFQPQFRVRGDRQGAGGEFLDPVCLAGRNSGRRRGGQPPCPVRWAGGEFGRAFHRQRGGGRAAAALRLGRGGLEQRGDLFVRMQGGGGQVPGSPVWLVTQSPGELAVRRGTLRERRGMVDG